MASVRCPACRSRKVRGTICSRCGHDLTGPAPDVSGASLGSRLWARLSRRPVDTSYRTNMPWRRPLLVGLMSAAVIGSGHFYCRDYKVGAAYLGAAIVLTWSVININLWALFLLAVIWNYQIFSAYNRAVEFDWAAVFKADERE